MSKIYTIKYEPRPGELPVIEGTLNAEHVKIGPGIKKRPFAPGIGETGEISEAFKIMLDKECLEPYYDTIKDENGLDRTVTRHRRKYRYEVLDVRDLRPGEEFPNVTPPKPDLDNVLSKIKPSYEEPEIHPKRGRPKAQPVETSKGE